METPAPKYREIFKTRNDAKMEITHWVERMLANLKFGEMVSYALNWDSIIN